MLKIRFMGANLYLVYWDKSIKKPLFDIYIIVLAVIRGGS